MTTDYPEYIRQQIKELNKERAQATLEKGLSAQDNKDLRENSEYDYWVEKETKLMIKIGTLMKEIERLTKVDAPPTQKQPIRKSKVTQKPTERIKDLPRNKWL